MRVLASVFGYLGVVILAIACLVALSVVMIPSNPPPNPTPGYIHGEGQIYALIGSFVLGIIGVSFALGGLFARSGKLGIMLIAMASVYYLCFLAYIVKKNADSPSAYSLVSFIIDLVMFLLLTIPGTLAFIEGLKIRKLAKATKP